MTAFPEYPVTQTANYLRQNAVKMGFRPALQVGLVALLKMNDNGIVEDGVPKLRCLDGARLCPCNEVENGGDCDQGLFRRA